MFLSSCTQSKLARRQIDKITTIESRIVVLEKEKLKSVADLQAETTRLLEKFREEIENFRKSQQFFIEELDGLKEDASQITNDNEKAQHDIRKISLHIQQLDRRIGDQLLTLDELKKFFDSSVNTTNTNSPAEKSAFDKVFQQYKKKNFKIALIGFEEFRKNYPESKLIDDTMFFTAYIYFLTGEYNTSSLRFFELLEQYPSSKRINEVKWWLGISLEKTGDRNGALDLYRELSKLDKQNPLQIKATFRLEELESQSQTK